MLEQAHKLPAWIFSTCRVISALAADLRMESDAREQEVPVETGVGYFFRM